MVATGRRGSGRGVAVPGTRGVVAAAVVAERLPIGRADHMRDAVLALPDDREPADLERTQPGRVAHRVDLGAAVRLDRDGLAVASGDGDRRGTDRRDLAHDDAPVIP